MGIFTSFVLYLPTRAFTIFFTRPAGSGLFNGN